MQTRLTLPSPTQLRRQLPDDHEQDGCSDEGQAGGLGNNKGSVTSAALRFYGMTFCRINGDGREECSNHMLCFEEHGQFASSA
jgi:hypothetical protein